MALTVTHAYEATGADDPEAEINRAEWNDDHVITGDYLRKATVTLSSADILDLHNTPVTLVAAPGAGKWLVVHRIAEYLSFGTVAYTVGGNQPIVNYAGEPTELVGCTTLDSGEDATQSSPALNVYVLASAAVNKALVLFVDGAGLTDGDGTLTVTIWYTEESVP